MKQEDMLIVQQKADGTWPSTEKWMEGCNETSGDLGEFPAGAYVEFMEEFIKPNPPPAVHPETKPMSRTPPLPSPRHVATHGYGTLAENDIGQHGRRGEGRADSEEAIEEEPDDAVPPPPPPRRSIGNMQNNAMGVRSQLRPHAPPRPAPRKNSSLDAMNFPPIVTSACHPLTEAKHNWVYVTFRIPVQCNSCKLLAGAFK